MSPIKLIACGILSFIVSSIALAKTEQVTLKANVYYGEESVVFPTTKGEVILNSYAIPAKVVPQVKPYKKGQCLEIKSKHGFFKDTGDGQYIESIQPCTKKGLATPKVNH
ncbi:MULTISPECIES: hypothetical protein [Acinetobacter calcoaceticus/baumannii complex]|uniref:hypothetical protein n=1 Tax=Acinetobacter calcoaceticus/baumannii complex TaxID=909768 RepID=UPI00044F6711|nr:MULTISPECIES: hypothetical protein [Acinetobacter calcoaceticus/baumannii complex]EXE59576.1 hypothetical protein J580_2972 [Acinetobacter sp. 1542444]MDD9315890.1 hypothetical protein [Acinetobacter lactucae]